MCADKSTTSSPATPSRRSERCAPQRSPFLAPLRRGLFLSGEKHPVTEIRDRGGAASPSIRELNLCPPSPKRPSLRLLPSPWGRPFSARAPPPLILGTAAGIIMAIGARASLSA